MTQTETEQGEEIYLPAGLLAVKIDEEVTETRGPATVDLTRIRIKKGDIVFISPNGGLYCHMEKTVLVIDGLLHGRMRTT